LSANSSAGPTAISVRTSAVDFKVRHNEVHSHNRHAKKQRWKRNKKERVKEGTVEDPASNKLSSIGVTNRTGMRQ
jgi:hypothetical protein